MQKAVARRFVRSVSRRNCVGAPDTVSDGYGSQRGSVSRHWRGASRKQPTERLEGRLGELDLIALMIGGIEFRQTLVVVILGLVADGQKHVLGLGQGPTENATVCTAPDGLVERELRTDRAYPYVIDGSKAETTRVLNIPIRQPDHAGVPRAPRGREREQSERRNEILARLVAGAKSRFRRDRAQQVLERRHEVRFVENDQGVRAQEPRVIRPHLARDAVSLEQEA
jgi:hypothetical protein